MSPVRVALIGLSQSAKTSWASQAHLPYLLTERGRQRYQIVALCNSSEDAAKRAIKAYDLPSDVKAYGSPHDLAADPDVDLVVCSTRVDVHYETIEPSVKAGKNVFVEWPLAENVGRATKLADEAKQSGSTTLIGLQGRVAPYIQKLKEFIEGGAIGKVVSSDAIAYTPGGGGFEISEGLAYFMDKKIGGNPVTIGVGHTIDYIHTVLGEFESSNAHLKIQRPNQTIINRDTGVTRQVVSDVPDLVSVHGTLRTSDYVTQGATLILNFRSGPPFPGTAPFVWTIVGEKGRIQVSNPRGPYIQATGAGFPTTIQVEDFATNEVKEVTWEWEEWQEPLPAPGRNIAKVYDLYYEGKAHESGVADFAGAVVRHTQIDKLLYE